MKTSYQRLAAFIIVNFVVLYGFTYIHVEETGHMYVSINRFYMSGMMLAAVVISLVLLMPKVFLNKKLNTVILLISAMALILLFRFARTQTLVGNRQFLRSMISHHSSAVVMCTRALITEPKVRSLCKEITRDQKAEIDFMRELLKQ